MSKVLYITANPKEESTSYSLQLGSAFLKAYKQNNPNDTIEVIDLYIDYIPLIDKDILSSWDKLAAGTPFSGLSADEQKKAERFNALTDQFIATDKFIFVSPMWNLNLPTMMKAYIDTAIVANKTFKYTATGPVGLLSNKKVVHVQSSGGIYSDPSNSAYNIGNTYLKTILSFIGITEFHDLFIEGIAYAPDQADQIKEKAIAAAVELAKTF